MSNNLEDKQKRLQELLEIAAENRRIRKEKEAIKIRQATISKNKHSDDINEIVDKALTSSAFEERKKKEEEELASVPRKDVDANLCVALDQWEHSINPAIRNFLNQPIQWELAVVAIGDSEDSDEKIDASEPDVEVEKIVLNKTNVNGLPMISELPDGLVDKEKYKEEDEPEVKRMLDEQEANEVMASSTFDNFFSKASRLVERGLSSEGDIIGCFERLEIDDSGVISKDVKLVEKATFMKDSPVKRPITNIEWSPKHKELFLCSYYKSENDWDPKETDGLVNIFSTQMPERAELTLTCQSEITSCIFHPTEPYLVIGGTYSGNVLIWDMREKRNYPSSKSQIPGSTMIKGISVVGTQNANSIVTVSNNGTTCVWSLNMMREPQKRVDLGTHSSEIPVHCIDFPEGETNQFYLGGEDFNIYSAKIHTKKQSEDNISDRFSGHLGTILSLHSHPAIHERKSSASGLLLSTAADWGIGIWHPQTRKDPLLLVDGDVEYYDAQWSPVHPSVFATCNGNGQIDLWDLAKDIEESRYRLDADKKAINKIRWSHDGKKLLTGNSNGEVKLYSVNEEFYQSREEDLIKLERMMKISDY